MITQNFLQLVENSVKLQQLVENSVKIYHDAQNSVKVEQIVCNLDYASLFKSVGKSQGWMYQENWGIESDSLWYW